jgi:hypothetical protein
VLRIARIGEGVGEMNYLLLRSHETYLVSVHVH